MRFTDIFIKRPVLAISLSFLIALLGFQAIFKMQVREYPEVTNTVITVSTGYYGASSDLIQGSSPSRWNRRSRKPTTSTS